MESPAGVEITELPGARISRISVGPLDNNVYLVEDLVNKSSVLIDAANDTERILALIDNSDSHVELILTTHEHADHWQSLADVARELSVPTAIGHQDAPGVPVPADQLLMHGDELQIGSLVLPVIELRGHTPGSVAVTLTCEGTPAHVFTGDALFPGGVGRTTTPENFTMLLDDVTQHVFHCWPDSSVVRPGHGKSTTLGAERPHLSQWRERGW